MRALTVYQPHAMMLAIGLRTIETRGWPTPYRGPILIHAAKRWNSNIAEDCRVAGNQLRRQYDTLKLTESQMQLTESQMQLADTPWGETRGCVLAVATISDCIPIPEPCGTEFDRSWGGFGPGRYGFVLTDLKTLSKPVAAVGEQQLWRPDEALIEECLKAVTQ